MSTDELIDKTQGPPEERGIADGTTDPGEGVTEAEEPSPPSDEDKPIAEPPAVTEERKRAIERAEMAIADAYSTGKAERAKITRMAQLDAAEAVAMVGVAMEADEEADDAMRMSVIAERSGNRERAKVARQREREARRKANADHHAATQAAKQAYDAIRFSAPNKMGFMRVVQILFALHIALVLIYLMLTSRDNIAYDMTTIMDWIMVIFEGVAFWTFINRYKIGRYVVIAMAAVGLVVPVLFDILSGKFNPFALSFNGLFYLLLLLYFIFSKRVKATLVNDLGKQSGAYSKDDFAINRHGWPFIRNLIIYFIVFSVLGHWMEMGMCQFIIWDLVEGEYDPTNTMLWRDFLYPFPMEGAAVVIIALVLHPFFLWLKKRFTGKRAWLAYAISFVAGALLCSVIEFTMGLIVNADHQLWDYSNQFGNIMGQVCLQNTLAFGVVASIITWWVYPMMERWIARVPRNVMDIVAVVIFAFGAIIWSLYIVNPPGVDNANLPEYKDHPEVVQQHDDQLMLGTQMSEIDQSLADLDSTIESVQTEKIDKDKLHKETQELREELMRILNEDVGLQAYPNTYEKIITYTKTERAA